MFQFLSLCDLFFIIIFLFIKRIGKLIKINALVFYGSELVTHFIEYVLAVVFISTNNILVSLHQ